MSFQDSPVPYNLLTRRKQSGATFVEFLLVSVIVFLMLIALVDTARYLFYQVVLTRAAEQAVNWAKKESRLTNDVRIISSPSAETLAAYADARNETVDIATRFARSQFYPSASENEKKLIRMRMADPQNGWVPSAGAVELDAALIMPGQTVQVITINTAGEEVVRDVNHPTCSAAQSCGQVSMAGSDGWEKLLIDHPLVVQIRAQFPLYLFLGQADIEIIGQAAAWQERVPIGTSPAPNISPTATVSVAPTPLPAPTLCSAVGETAACNGKCTQPWETCIFQPNNMTPNCTTCGLKPCSQWTSAGNWCKNNGSCADYQTCSFNPNGTGNACETCTPKYCYQWTNKTQACAALDNCPSADNRLTCDFYSYNAAPNCAVCRTKYCYEWTNQLQACSLLNNCATANNTQTCDFYSYNSAPNCASCRTKYCYEWTNQTQACTAAGCVAADGSKICDYYSYNAAPNCTSCRTKYCYEWTNQTQACALLNNCITPNNTQTCDYYSYNSAPNCASCRTKYCYEWTNQTQACIAANCVAADGSKVCDFYTYNSAPNCASCRTKYCYEWTNQTQACALLNNCSTPNNTQTCDYSSYNSAPNCASCRTKYCYEWTTQAQWCRDHGCLQPWQTCQFSSYNSAPNCGTGSCSDALCSAWTNASTACAGVTCPAGQTCEFLPNNTGQNCTRCRSQICSDVTNQAAACAAIGCDTNYNTCTWDPSSRNIPTCGATCTPKPCSQLTQSQVCYAGRCSAYQNCSLNMSGTPPNNCYTCTPILCSAWTTQSAVCAQCAPGQTCQWFPNNAAPNCGSCANICVGTCKPGELWDPVHCRCVGSS